MWCRDWTRDSLEGQMEPCWDTALPAVALAGVLRCSRVQVSATRWAVDLAGVCFCWNPKQRDSQTPVYMAVCVQMMCVCVLVGTVSKFSEVVAWGWGGGVNLKCVYLCCLESFSRDKVLFSSSQCVTLLLHWKAKWNSLTFSCEVFGGSFIVWEMLWQQVKV